MLRTYKQNLFLHERCCICGLKENLVKQAGVLTIPLILEYHLDCSCSKKWDIWEIFSMQKKADEMKAEFEETVIKASLDEYPIFNREYEESCILK